MSRNHAAAKTLDGQMVGAGALRLGDALLDTERGLLLDAAGLPVTLRPKAWLLLQALARTPGRLLTKQQLLDAVWPGLVVTDDSLVQAVADIRRALGLYRRACLLLWGLAAGLAGLALAA